MKKIIILLFVILVGTPIIHAQEESIKSYIHVQDSIFQHLNKENIPTGALYDRVYQWADLEAFTNEDTVNYTFAMQAWHELYLSIYQPDGFLTTSEARNKSIQNELDGKVISIGYIIYQYNHFDSNV